MPHNTRSFSLIIGLVIGAILTLLAAPAHAQVAGAIDGITSPALAGLFSASHDVLRSSPSLGLASVPTPSGSSLSKAFPSTASTTWTVPTAAPTAPKAFTQRGSLSDEISKVRSHMQSEFSQYVSDIEGWTYAFGDLFSFMLAGSMPIRRVHQASDMPPQPALAAQPTQSTQRGHNNSWSSRRGRRHPAPGAAATGAPCA